MTRGTRQRVRWNGTDVPSEVRDLPAGRYVVEAVDDDAPTLLADLLIQLQKAIAARGLTQANAAKILRVTQPRVSDLLRGRLDLFSTDTLIDMLARLSVRVRFVGKSSRRRLKLT
jgi:predicted XRE-type DNA-binding protein